MYKIVRCNFNINIQYGTIIQIYTQANAVFVLQIIMRYRYLLEIYGFKEFSFIRYILLFFYLV